jgi:hypothetical protein
MTMLITKFNPLNSLKTLKSLSALRSRGFAIRAFTAHRSRGFAIRATLKPLSFLKILKILKQKHNENKM